MGLQKYIIHYRAHKHKLLGQKMHCVLFISETFESPFLAKTECVCVRNNWSFCGAKRSAFFCIFPLCFITHLLGRVVGGAVAHWRSCVGSTGTGGAQLYRRDDDTYCTLHKVHRDFLHFFACIPCESWMKDNKEKYLDMILDDLSR